MKTSSGWARVWAIARRDAVIELSYRFVLLSRAVGFAFSVATLYFVAKLVPSDQIPDSGGYFEFALIGLLLGYATALGLGNFTQTISIEQSTGSLEVLLATPTALPTLLVGALVVPLALTMVEIVGVLFVAVVFLGADLHASGLLTALLALPLVVAVFCSFGVFSAAVVVLTKRGDPFTVMFTRVSTFLAGALFPISVMPGALQVLAKAFPAYYSL
jgi:ABC-2 type transport system permease protein